MDLEGLEGGAPSFHEGSRHLMGTMVHNGSAGVSAAPLTPIKCQMQQNQTQNQIQTQTQNQGQLQNQTDLMYECSSAMGEDAGGVDEFLAYAGYNVRASDLAHVAQKLEELESMLGASQDVGLSHLSCDTVHYNPSDLASWVEYMLEELNPAVPGSMLEPEQQGERVANARNSCNSGNKSLAESVPDLSNSTIESAVTTHSPLCSTSTGRPISSPLNCAPGFVAPDFPDDFLDYGGFGGFGGFSAPSNAYYPNLLFAEQVDLSRETGIVKQEIDHMLPTMPGMKQEIDHIIPNVHSMKQEIDHVLPSVQQQQQCSSFGEKYGHVQANDSMQEYGRIQQQPTSHPQAQSQNQTHQAQAQVQVHQAQAQAQAHQARVPQAQAQAQAQVQAQAQTQAHIQARQVQTHIQNQVPPQPQPQVQVQTQIQMQQTQIEAVDIAQESGVRLVHLLLACAEAVQRKELLAAEEMINQIFLLVATPQCGPMARVANYFAEALKQRIYAFSNLESINTSNEDEFSEVSYIHFYEACPYLKFAHFTANQVILEAFESHQHVHVIDLDLKYGLQWPALIQALALRPGGPPSLRLTGVGTGSNEALKDTGGKLAQLAESMHVEFHFHWVHLERLSDFDPWALQIKVEEVVAVNSMFQFHKLLPQCEGEEDLVGEGAAGARFGAIHEVFRWVKRIKPRIVTVVEQDANHNSPVFLDRFMASLHYYSTLFDSLEACQLTPNSIEQLLTEHYLSREICNIVACEGKGRFERHETLAQWRVRMGNVGFKPRHLGSNAFNQASTLLNLFNDGYSVMENRGCLTLGWHSRPLIAVSAWQCC